MYREELNSLKKWKQSSRRKPLIIRGARQVGKTWLMQEFGRLEYNNFAYINLDNNSRMKELFRQDLKIERIISGLEIEAEMDIDPSNTLIILDEIQEVPNALNSLKYFCENAAQYHVITAGSLLGVALHPDSSFPVGKVSFLDLYPMSFYEFLHALASPKLFTAYQEKEWDLIKSFKETFISFLKQYYFIGGMPEAVAAFKEEASLVEVREIQIRILTAYDQDFSKHAPNEIVPRIRMLWESIPAQLSKEHSKFVYGLVKQGARAREYEMAMSWLIDCGLIHKVTRISKPHLPLKAYEDPRAFKLFILDTGLLGAMTSLSAKSLLEGNELFTEFKGALTEQYVLQQLICIKELPVHYWSSEKGTAEIDFVIQDSSGIIPIEVKAETNLKAKSLKAFRTKYNSELSIRSSLSDYRVDDGLANIPLYALHDLSETIKHIYKQ
ncbi:MAG: ATP-binding protein [Lentisphaeria bacterium]|nr:ATP-binding protein [Lentisphaeria bacterium]NQZ70094.1 ATP-binding protein [Lentisphaeria bacterium]